MLGVVFAFVSVQRGLPVTLWRSRALCYCVVRDSRAFGVLWVSRNLEGAMRAPLHEVLLVLLCSVYMALSRSLRIF